MTGDDELLPEGPPRWVWRSLVGISLVLVVGVLVSAALIGMDALHRQDQIVRISARNDCRSEVNARLQEKKDTLVNLRAQAQLEIDKAQIARFVNQPVDLQAAYDQFVKTDAMLQAASKVVDGLPRLDIAVDRGYTLDGHHYPACPTVN